MPDDQTTLTYSAYTYYLCRNSVQVGTGGLQVVN